MDTIKLVTTHSSHLPGASLIKCLVGTPSIRVSRASKVPRLRPRRKATNVCIPVVVILGTLQLTAWTEIAKDSNVGVGDRATAAKDALGNKVDETKHDVSSFPRPIMCSVDSNCETDKIRGLQTGQVNVHLSRPCDHRHGLAYMGQEWWIGGLDWRLWICIIRRCWGY